MSSLPSVSSIGMSDCDLFTINKCLEINGDEFLIRIFYQKYLFNIPNFEWNDASKTFYYQLSQIIKQSKMKVKFWERTKFEKN